MERRLASTLPSCQPLCRRGLAPAPCICMQADVVLPYGLLPQVNRSLAVEREAKKAAEKDRALVQIVLDAKQRLADAMREVRTFCSSLHMISARCHASLQ